MTAKCISNQPPSGSRTELAKKLPLKTPYVLQIFPVYACNFRCQYCVLSIPGSERTNPITSKKYLDINVFKKCIDDLSAFPDKIKVLRFCGVGEPLLHKEIVEMVKYAKSAGVADSIELLTNGSMLSPELSNNLVQAGLSKIRISIQGTDREKYAETTQGYDDINHIISNIRYLYKIRGSLIIYVKIVDVVLRSPDDEEVFFKLFSDISDFIAVEHLFPSSPQINYGNAQMNVTQNGTEIVNTNICSQPFFLVQLHPDGMVEPCCGMESPPFVGNINSESLSEIWNGGKMNNFRIMQLRGDRSACSGCQLYLFNTFPEDVLDNDKERLLEIFCKESEKTMSTDITDRD